MARKAFATITVMFMLAMTALVVVIWIGAWEAIALVAAVTFFSGVLVAARLRETGRPRATAVA